jgi:hypothetical protein
MPSDHRPPPPGVETVRLAGVEEPKVASDQIEVIFTGDHTNLLTARL